MKFTAGPAILLLLFVAVNAEYKFKDCGNGNSAIKFHKFVIGPDPVVVNWVTRVTIDADIEVTHDLDDDMEMSVGIKKVGRLVNVPVPFRLRKSICQIVRSNSTSKIACDALAAAGLPCTCPIKAGHYYLRGQPVEVDIRKFKIPGLSTLLKLGSGKYETTISLKHKREPTISSCLKINNQSKVQMK